MKRNNNRHNRRSSVKKKSSSKGLVIGLSTLLIAGVAGLTYTMKLLKHESKQEKVSVKSEQKPQFETKLTVEEDVILEKETVSPASLKPVAEVIEDSKSETPMYGANILKVKDEVAGVKPDIDEVDHSVCKKLGYCIHKAKEEGLEDEANFKKEVVTLITDLDELKTKIKPLMKDKKLEEVIQYLDSFEGEEQTQVAKLKRIIQLQIFARDKIEEARQPLVSLSKNPKKEILIDYEAIAREEKRRKTIERQLRLHNDIVDIGMDMLIVFNNKTAVIKYSKLIKACENRASKFFEVRKQRAVDFLDEQKASISIIPHNNQKVKIRRGGGTICQVYYGTSHKDEYGYAHERRNIGYILTYDLKPLPPGPGAGGGGGGC